MEPFLPDRIEPDPIEPDPIDPNIIDNLKNQKKEDKEETERIEKLKRQSSSVKSAIKTKRKNPINEGKPKKTEQ